MLASNGRSMHWYVHDLTCLEFSLKRRVVLIGEHVHNAVLGIHVESKKQREKDMNQTEFVAVVRNA